MAAKELIKTITVGSGGAAAIEFTSIPQDGTDLLVVVSVRESGGGYAADSYIKLNGLTSNYSFRNILGDGSSVSSNNNSGGYPGGVFESNGNGATSNTFSSMETWIPNYAGSNVKMFSTNAVTENNDTGSFSQIWAQKNTTTSAITSVAIVSQTGWVQYSSASLYKFTKGSGGATVS